MTKDELRSILNDAGAVDSFGHEIRTVKQMVEAREDEGGDDSGPAPRLEGHAAVFNKETNIAGFFREMIAPGAFNKTIGEADVRLLFNHDPNQILARNKSGSLDLREDDTGLFYSGELNMNDPQAVSVFEKVKRGDVDQSSFAFQVVREEWEEPDARGDSDLPLRTILEARLFDVSPVTYPAYEQTSVVAKNNANEAVIERLGLRSLADHIANEDFDPELAPALRDAASHIVEYADACEAGSDCDERAAEEALEDATEERAAEEAPVINEHTDGDNSTVTLNVTVPSYIDSGGTGDYRLTINHVTPVSAGDITVDEREEEEETENVSVDIDELRLQAQLRNEKWKNEQFQRELDSL